MRHKTHASLLIALLFIALLALVPLLLRADEAAEQELDDIWARVRQAGAYQYSAEVRQTTTPQPSVTNAGRQSKDTNFYLEGETNLNSESLHLRLWSEGGSVLVPESALEIKVEGQTAQARKGSGAWEDIDDFTGLFAPGGDFMAYTRAAENVIAHPPEIHSTLLGEIAVTRYTFDIDGYQYAAQMRSRLMEQASREGLPPGVQLELPRMYKDMTGTGELWVGADGLPLRQQFTLNFPPTRDGDSTTAEITVNFSDFVPPASLPAMMPALRMALQGLSILPLAAVFLIFAFILVIRSHSQLVYRITAVAIIISMLIGPLLSSQLVHAYGARQQAKQNEQEQRRAELDAQQEARQAAQQPTVDPHRDPLAVARQQKDTDPAVAAVDGSGRYFDPSCVSDPHGDMDQDDLTNLEECLLGTLPQVADTDDDGAEDGLEVIGFQMPNSQGQMVTWYTDPLNIDTNKDGIADGKEWYLDATGDGKPDDTDGDGTPDMWDEDNDGDGVPDDLDLSAYANTRDAVIFNEHNPFELVINDLNPGKLINVEFQLSPTNPEHLWYSKNVLDWPGHDRQGQIQDVDGATFLDVNPDVSPVPNDFGDMRLVPLLEIDISGDPDQLPEQDILDQFAISVHRKDENTQSAYVPLELVTEEQGKGHTGFYGRMVYRAGSSWGAAHQVRLIWAVQMLNDVCGYPEDPPAGYPSNAAWPPDPNQPPPGWSGDWPGEYSLFQDGLCQFYSAYNEPMIIQTYDDEWFLTGLMTAENHGADMALIYEDPVAANNALAGYDAPFYMDTLFGLVYGLDHTFLAASDCETLDTEGQCVGNGQRDVTVPEIARRFNHATNGGVSDEQRWNLPNVLNVEMNSYESFDLGLIDTVVTQTVDLLDQNYTSAWSAAEPITPTVMLAVEQSYRAANLDQTNGGSPLFNWNGRGLTLDLPQSGADEVEVETIASVKWSPYSYDPVDGWTEANMAIFWNDMTDQLGSSFDSLTDPEEAETYHTMSQIAYMSIYGGINNVVQIGDKLMEAKYALPDAPIAFGLSGEVGNVLIVGMQLYVDYSQALALAARQARFSWEYRPGAVPKQLVLGKFWQQQVAFYGSGLVAAAVFFLLVTSILVLATALILNYVVNDTSVPWNIIAAVSVGVLLTIVNVINPIISVVRIAKTAAAIGGSITSFSAQLKATLGASSKVIGASKTLSIVGLIISIGVAIGVFIWALTTDDGVTWGDNPAFYTLLAWTIASIIVSVLLFVLALTVVGAIIVGLITLVDTILFLLGEDFSITGAFTQALATIIYRYNITTPTINTGALGAELSDLDLGYVANNQLRYTLPVTTTYRSFFGPTESMLLSSFVYQLNDQKARLSTSLGARENDWIVGFADPDNPLSGYAVTLEDEPAFTGTLAAGVNVSANLTFNYAYALRGRECWALFFCNYRTVSDHDSERLGRTYIFDVLPSSLEDFVDVNRWGFGAGGPASFLDPDGDGLLDPSQGGLDPDNRDWDSDDDGLSDGYELTVRSTPAFEGGVNLNPQSADSDNDGVPDKVELLYGTDPAHPDSDGDGLSDAQEIEGWLFPYRFNPGDGSTVSTRIYSNPLHADGDGDGLSDRFEQAQLICPTCDPWANPDDPELFNPNVWNESPVALYIDNNTNDDYVALGETFVYSTTTTNNLSGGQRVVGQLSLDLPGAFSGGPLEAQVDIQQGNSQSLVSQLTADSSQTAAHDLTSIMDLSSFDQTIWNWNAPDLTAANAVHGAIDDTAVARIPASTGRLAVVTREVDSQGVAAIGYYQVWSDGTVQSSRKMYVAGDNSESLTALDITCNDNGVCLAVWGANSPTQNHILAGRIEVGSAPSELSIWQPEIGSTATVAAPAVASDGQRFLVSFAVTDPGGTRLLAQRINQGGNQPTPVETITGLGSGLASVSIDWAGEAYLAVWVDGGTIYRAALDVDGAAGSVQPIGAGGGWPQLDGTVQAPRLVFDPLSQQGLLLYRTELNGNNRLTARILTVATDGSEFLIDDDLALNTDGVVVAASADPQNSGWVLAWSIPGNEEAHFRAVGPDGSLRGDVSGVDQSSITAVGLSCFLPQTLLRLQFEEPAGAMAFEDSSGNEYIATCTEGSCPQSGIPGRFGNGVRFSAANNQSLTVSSVSNLLSNRSFTLAAWAKRDSTNNNTAILSHGENLAHKRLVLGFDFFNRFTCDFGGGNSVTTGASYTDTDWHHWACTYDSRTRTRTIYRDGIQVAQNKANVNYAGNGPLVIGNSSFSSLGFFDGLLDDVTIWQRPLSAQEMSEIASSLTAVYSLDEVPGSTSFADGSGNAYSASCTGSSCPTLGVPGKSFSAARFDGVDDFIQLDSRPESTGQFFYDFESQTAPGWNRSDITLGARDTKQTWFLGPFNNQNLTLNLSNLPQHDTVEVSFDLYVAGEWAGTRTDLGPHNWEWGYANQPLLATNFSTLDDTTGNYQLYPDDSWTIDPVTMTNTYGGLPPGTKCPGATAGTYTEDTPDVLHWCADVTERTVAFLYSITNYNGAPWPMDPKRNVNVHRPTGFIRSVRIWPAANKPRHGREPDLLAIAGYPLDRNTVFHIKGTIPNHFANSLQLYFRGSNLTPGFSGQGWGVDNVLVTTRQEGNTIPLADSSFTLSAWAKRDSSGRHDFIITQGRGANYQGLLLGYLDTDQLRCNFWNDTLTTSAGYTDTNWHHIACTYDAQTRQRRIYRDGDIVAQDTTNGNYTGFGPTYIGKRFDDTRHFQGTLDEVSIWNSALSETEVKQLFQNVKVENQSSLSCMLPLASSDETLTLGNLTLRETTTELGDIKQELIHQITIDNDPPSAAITATYFDENGPGGYVSSSGALIVAGAASDPTSYISQVELNPGSGWQTTAGTESWSYSWSTAALSDGPQTLQLRALDAVGNVSPVSSWTAVLDTTPPAITYATPAGFVQPYRDALGRWLVPLSGTVADPAAGSRPGSGVHSVEILLQGSAEVAGYGWQQAAVASDGTWHIEYVLPEFDNANRSLVEPRGVFTVSARAADELLNTTAAADYSTLAISIDTVGPVVSASATLSETEVIASAFTLEGSVVDAQAVTAVEINLTPAQQISAFDSTILHLPFDQRHDTAYFADQSGHANPATCGSGSCPQLKQPGRRDKAITLDGSADFLSVEELDLANQSFTMAAWAKRAAPGANDFILSQGQEALNGAVNFGFLETDQLRCGFWQDVVTTAESFSDTGWHHLACTYDVAGSTIRLYRDGVELLAETVTGNYTGSGPLYIGKRFDDSRYFNGSLDELVVYNRPLAAYEIANLYAYGLGTWETAELNADQWSYPLAADSNIEDFYQLNVRGFDALGNVTPQGGQRVWRGEIDTRPPEVSFPVEVETVDDVTTTTYTCLATDFSLDGSFGCKVRGSAPGFRKSDESFTTYEEVDPWYAAFAEDSSRLYGLEAQRTVDHAIPNVGNLSVEVCDKYNHCTTAGAELLPGPAPQAYAELLEPSNHTVFTTLEPRTMSGYIHDVNGLQALFITANGEPVHAQVWPEGETTGSHWQFTWTPPAQGIYDFELFFSDWKIAPAHRFYFPAFFAHQPAGSSSVYAAPAEAQQDRLLPVNERRQTAVAYLESGIWPQAGEFINDLHTGTPATIYVDLAPPTDSIEPVPLTMDDEIGIDSVRITGGASDAVQLHHVDVRIDGGAWQRAGLDSNGRWQLPWHPPGTADGQTYEITVQAEDLAGNITTNTQMILVDLEPPLPGPIHLAYYDSAGERQTFTPGDTLTDAVELEVTWAAGSDGSGIAAYEVGFTTNRSSAPDNLTSFPGPGTYRQAVGQNQRWFANVQIVDGAGNKNLITLGPVFITPP